MGIEKVVRDWDGAAHLIVMLNRAEAGAGAPSEQDAERLRLIAAMPEAFVVVAPAAGCTPSVLSFSGRFSQDELDKLGKGPMIIKERVRIIGGALTVESTPGSGSRLEVKVPKDGDVSDEF